MLLQRRAMIGPEFENAESAARKILLIRQVFVADDEQIETGQQYLHSANSATIRSQP